MCSGLWAHPLCIFGVRSVLSGTPHVKVPFYQTQIYYPDLLSRLYGITGQLALYEDGGIADQETRVVPLLVALPSTCMGNVNKSLMSLGVLNNQVLGLENDLAKNTVA